MTFFYELKNFLVNDTLSDWFDKITNIDHNYDFVKDKENEFQIEIKNQKETYFINFISFLKDFNDPFYENLNHDEIMNHLKNNHQCIIFKGIFYDKKNNLYLQPDFIIHKDVFIKIFNQITNFDIDDLPEYIIFDLLYKKISFNSDKTNILNDNTIYYHKCKLYYINQLLYKKNNYGFLFAKEYKHQNKSLIKKETIGFFNFEKENYNIQSGIQWINKLNQDYKKWIIYPKPSCIELYPNLNIKTGHWNEEKKRLGELIKEITLIWNITYSKRCLLIEKGITEWDDPILLSNIYPYKVKENKKKLIQDKMIYINSQNDIKISPRKIKNNDFINIIKNKNNSIILDIESIIDLQEKENYFNNDIITEKPKICIIGTIITDTNIFKDFTIKYCTLNEEKKIIEYWLSYIKNQIKNDIIRIYHWGNAEKVYIDYMKQKYPDLNYPQFEFIDLLSYFKSEPITIKGCFSYGLKDIVNSLYNLNLLKDKWIDDTNGLDAMTELMKTSNEAQIKNIPMKRFIQIKNIIYYNYIDCKVLIDILNFLEDMI